MFFLRTAYLLNSPIFARRLSKTRSSSCDQYINDVRNKSKDSYRKNDSERKAEQFQCYIHQNCNDTDGNYRFDGVSHYYHLSYHFTMPLADLFRFMEYYF